MTEAIYLEVQKASDEFKGKRQFSVSGVLRRLGVSRSGYNTWKKRLPSNQQKRKEMIKDKIQKIYKESHQNYGAPKITKELNQEGEKIAEKTVGNYMREMGIGTMSRKSTN